MIVPVRFSFSPNGDYVVLRPSWDSPTVQDAGAVTRINGDTGLTGFVDATNSLVGPRTATFRGATLTELTNGNFVIAQPNWTDDEGTTIGAATLIDSSGEATGVFDASTSLVGSSEDDFEDVVVTPLSNGNYVVETPFWDDETLVNAAAVTWQSGTTAVGAEVSPAISVISAIFGAALDNGNVVLVRSTAFGFFDGTTGFSGTLSDSNSLGFHRSGRLPTFQMLPNGKIAVAFNVPDDGMGFDDGAFWIGEPVVGVNGEITPDNSVFGIPATFDGPGFSVVVLPKSNLVFEVLGNNTNSVYFANGTALQTGTYAEDDGIFANSAYGLLTGNFVVEGRRTNGEYFIELIDGSTGPSEQTPSSVSIAGRFSVALGNGNFAVCSGQDIVIGDGSTRGVVATATPGVLGAGGALVPLSDSGNLISVNPSFDLGNMLDVGSIVFMDGSPDFTTGTVESNFWVGTTPGAVYRETTLDEVNDQFYVRFEIDGVSRIIAGSTIDGFATTGTEPAVNLSVSTNVASEADQTQITITATAASAVSGDQTVVVVPTGNGITNNDFSISNQTITIPDGQTSGSVTLTINSDNEVEGTESLLLTLVNRSSGIRPGDTTQQTIAITDNTIPLVLNDVPRFPTDTTPTFTWNDVGADRYEVWLGQVSPLSSRLQIDSRFVTDTSYTSTEELTPGLHRVWVRVADTDGSFSPWSTPEPFSYRPELISPLADVFPLRPTFTWEAIPGAEEYEIWIATRTGRIVQRNIFDTSWTPNQDLPAGDIRWWIRGLAPGAMNGRPTGWSEVGLASVGGRTEVLSPTGTITDTTPTFTWQAIDGSSRYILHVVDRTTGNVVIRENNVTTASFAPSTALSAGNFRVWVKAIDGSDDFNSGTWSKPVDFTIAAVTNDSPDEAFAPRLASLRDLLQTQDTAQRGQVAVTTESSARDIAMKAEPADGRRELQQQTDETGLPSVAAADSPELWLSLLWQQPLLQEWLLFEELS